MSLTFMAAPRMSAAHFARILTDTKSPAAPEAFKLYDVCAAAGIDPAVALAFFRHESTYGTAGINVGYNLRNWGSVRTPYDPTAALSIIAVPNNGSFAKYPTWTRGLQDWCDRIRIRYVAAGYDTIEKAIPRYAPSSDGNNVAAYIGAVQSSVVTWMAEEAGIVTIPTTGFADRTVLIPVSTDQQPDQRPGTKLAASRSFTAHETANEDPGATAEMHRRYWNPGGGGVTLSSIHFVADANESIQLIPTDEVAEHAGDPTGNTTSVGGEICVNSRAGYPAACRRMAKVIARWLQSVGLQPVDGVTVRKHGSWPGTTHRDCPYHLNKGDWGVTWADFMAMVKAEFTLLYVINYPQLWGDAADYERVKDFGIVVEWRRAATALGAPVSDETKDKDGRVWRLFAHGAIAFDPKTGACTSFFARAAS